MERNTKDIHLTGTRHAKETICALLDTQDELLAALVDATFLLRKIGKFPGDLPQMMDSITRCVQDCRAVIEKEQA